MDDKYFIFVPTEPGTHKLDGQVGKLHGFDTKEKMDDYWIVIVSWFPDSMYNIPFAKAATVEWL